jgi:hypothetical protein
MQRPVIELLYTPLALPAYTGSFASLRMTEVLRGWVGSEEFVEMVAGS